MSQTEARPYAAMTNDDLAGLSRSLARCADDLARQQVSVRAELEMRMTAQRSDLDTVPFYRNASPTVEYLAPAPEALSRVGIGDTYADSAKAYAFKAIGLAAAVACVLGVVGYLAVRSL